jgi:hypothetical protein
MFIELLLVVGNDTGIKSVIFNKNRIMSVHEEDNKCLIKVRGEYNQKCTIYTTVEEYETVKAKLLRH